MFPNNKQEASNFVSAYIFRENLIWEYANGRIWLILVCTTCSADKVSYLLSIKLECRCRRFQGARVMLFSNCRSCVQIVFRFMICQIVLRRPRARPGGGGERALPLLLPTVDDTCRTYSLHWNHRDEKAAGTRAQRVEISDLDSQMLF